MLSIGLLEPDELEQTEALTRVTAAGVNLKEELKRPFARVTLARTPTGTPMAYLCAWQIADELEIIDLATSDAFRRQGAARALVQELLEFGRQQQVSAAYLEVRVGNAAARSLYAALGFEETRKRERYYSNGEDAMEMRRCL